jgi:hypothetical protein
LTRETPSREDGRDSTISDTWTIEEFEHMNFRWTTISITWIVLSWGCASAKLTVIKPLPSSEEKVTLAFEQSSEITPSQASEFRTILSSRLQRSGVSVVAGDPPDVHDVSGNIAKYNPGDRALRYMIGFGAGRGSLDTTWAVRADTSPEPIGICQIVGSITMGVFGGNWNDVLEKVGDRLGDCLRGGQ